MKIVVSCSKCPDTSILVDMNGSYFGPEISCAKCNSIMLAAVVQMISVQIPNTPGFNRVDYTGTAVMPTNQTFFTWPPIAEITDAEHVPTCLCTECKCK